MIGLGFIVGVIAYVQGTGIPVDPSCPVAWQSESNVTDNLDLNVTCGDTYIDVSINPCILLNEGFAFDDVTINGLSGVSDVCNDLTDLSSSTTLPTTWSWRIPQPFNNCRTTSENDGDTITYRNALAVYKFSNTRGHVIWRKKLVYINFACRYTINYPANTVSPIEVVESIHNITEGLEEGEYNFTIRTCSDTSCNNLILPSTPIKVCYPIYIVIWTSRDVRIMIYEVTAYDLMNKTGDSHAIVDGMGCIVDDDDSLPATIDSTSYGITIICIYAFQWANNLDRDLYFELTFKFCDPYAGQDCTPPCMQSSGRRRRAVGYNSNRGLDADQGLTTATVGPLKVG